MRADNEGDGPVHSLRLNYKGPQLGGTFSANALISTDEFKDEQVTSTTTITDGALQQPLRQRSRRDRPQLHAPAWRQPRVGSPGAVEIRAGAGDNVGTCVGFCDVDDDGVNDGDLIQKRSASRPRRANPSAQRQCCAVNQSPELLRSRAAARLLSSIAKQTRWTDD